MSATVNVSVNLGSALEALELRRRAAVQELDGIIDAIAELRSIDQRLVDLGVQDQLQLPAGEAWPPAADEPGPAPADPPPVREPAEVVPITALPATNVASTAGGRRRFTDEEEAEYVREADEEGNDTAVSKRHGLSPGSLSQWRKAGFGRKVKSVKGLGDGAVSGPGHPRKPEVATGPSIRCPSCKTGVPVDGDPTNFVVKTAALKAHYRKSPACEADMRKARG